jgi:hypothetical protein
VLVNLTSLVIHKVTAFTALLIHPKLDSRERSFRGEKSLGICFEELRTGNGEMILHPEDVERSEKNVHVLAALAKTVNSGMTTKMKSILEAKNLGGFVHLPFSFRLGGVKIRVNHMSFILGGSFSCRASL